MIGLLRWSAREVLLYIYIVLTISVYMRAHTHIYIYVYGIYNYYVGIKYGESNSLGSTAVGGEILYLLL